MTESENFSERLMIGLNHVSHNKVTITKFGSFRLIHEGRV